MFTLSLDLSALQRGRAGARRGARGSVDSDRYTARTSHSLVIFLHISYGSKLYKHTRESLSHGSEIGCVGDWARNDYWCT